MWFKRRKISLDEKVLKKILFVSFSIFILLFIAYFIKKYAVQNRAAANPSVNLAMQPANVSVNTTQDNNFAVNFAISGQKVVAVELHIEYDPAYVEYFKEYNSGTGFSEVKDPGMQNYFDVPLFEEVSAPTATSKELKLILVSKFDDPANPGWTTNFTGNLKFRAKQPGTTVIRVNKTVTSLSGLISTGEATYFDVGTADIQSSITIAGTAVTPSPTVPITGTVTPTTPTTPIPTSLTPTVSPTPNNTTTTPNPSSSLTRTPPSITLKPVTCKNYHDEDESPADGNNDDDVAVITSFPKNLKDHKKQYNIIFLPQGYSDPSKFEADVADTIEYFRKKVLKKKVFKKIHFKEYMKLSKSYDVKHCDSSNKKKKLCWDKSDAKKAMRECHSDGYVLLVDTPKSSENVAQAQEVRNFWGNDSATWALGSGESLLFRYDQTVLDKTLTQSVAGSLSETAEDTWEKALEKFDY
ncbi:hypothetical protein BH09PAT2_BH09PAT2_05050 [soil metagenome]